MAARFDLDEPGVAHLLEYVQSGVVARFQLVADGASDSDIDRMIGRRELTRAHPGVYVAHSGALARAQREWVAVLAAWPAALADTAARAWESSAPITVVVEHGRKVTVPAGARIRQVRHLPERLHPGAEPPRLRVEHAVIDAMSRLIASGPCRGLRAAGPRVLRAAYDAGYGMVFRTPCLTAAQIATILRRRGWTGSAHRCPRCAAQR